MNKRNSNLSVFVFYTLIIMTVLFLILNCLTSGLLAKYISTDSLNETVTVASWEIDFEDNDELNTNIPSTHLENGSKGEWALDIINKSEVTAKMSENSSVKLRLYSPSFHSDHHHDEWDFLHDANGDVIDNPINFKIYAYNCSLDVLEENYLRDGVFDNSVQLEGMNVQQILILDTDITNIEFEMILVKDLICYEAVIEIGNLGEGFVLEHTDGSMCMRVVWDVTAPDSTYTAQDEFKSYHLIETSNYDSSIYSGVVTRESDVLINLSDESLNQEQISTAVNNNSYTIDDKSYVIVYKEYDAFEYLIYSSSLGGEAMITLQDVEGTYIKKSTQLNETEKAEVEARTNIGASNVDTLQKFVEKLEYKSYIGFLEEKAAFEEATGYLGLGLEITISLNLKVEQVIN